MKRLSIVILAAFAAASPMRGQSPAPVVVQALAPAQPAAASSTAPAAGTVPVASVLKHLQEVKAANDEVLKKQAATLQQLDEMEKSAEQIKVYTKRG